MTFVVGLTGGIGCGKTVVSDHFANMGATVVDTDVIARVIVEPGQPALSELATTFGDQILMDNGELDRAALRILAFSNTENKAKLDAITHPAIRMETFKQITATEYPYCIVVVPLLVADSEFAQLMQRTLVVTAEYETKIERVMQRSSITRLEVESIMKTQISDAERLAFADDVIENDGTIEEAQQQAEVLHQKYLDLSLQFSVGD